MWSHCVSNRAVLHGLPVAKTPRDGGYAHFRQLGPQSREISKRLALAYCSPNSIGAHRLLSLRAGGLRDLPPFIGRLSRERG